MAKVNTEIRTMSEAEKQRAERVADPRSGADDGEGSE